MRTNNKAEMDVIEQIEDAMAAVCDKICKHMANYEMQLYHIENGVSHEEYQNKITEAQKRLYNHCEECPLGVISHEFVHPNNG